jgi:phosphoribosylformimino-5-aminoimidazole carboxamide ribotide isomerase
VQARAPNHRIFAAGGVRGIADLNRLTELGAAGALLASALHDGSLASKNLAEYEYGDVSSIFYSR